MKRITFASTSKIDQFQTEVDELILAIAPFMIEPNEDEQDWADSVFVSDESRLGDFLSQESDLPALSEKLGLPLLERRDLIGTVAELLHQSKRPH